MHQNDLGERIQMAFIGFCAFLYFPNFYAQLVLPLE